MVLYRNSGGGLSVGNKKPLGETVPVKTKFKISKVGTYLALPAMILLLGGLYWLVFKQSPEPDRVLPGKNETSLEWYSAKAGLLTTISQQSGGSPSETQVTVWKLDNFEKVFSTRLKDFSGNFTLSDDGKWLAIRTYQRIITVSTTGYGASSGGYGAVRKGTPKCTLSLWSLEDGELKHEYPIDGFPGAITFSPDGARFLMSERVDDGTYQAQICDLASAEPVVKFNTGSNIAAFMPDGQSVVTNRVFESDKAFRGQYTFWDTASGAEIRSVTAHPRIVMGLSVSPDGTRIATSDEKGNLKIWDAQAGIELQYFPPPPEYPECQVKCQFSGDGRLLFASYFNVSHKADLNFASKALLEIMKSFGYSEQPVSPRIVHSCSILRETETGRVIRRTECENDIFPLFMTITPDAEELITINGKGEVGLWNFETLPDRIW